MLSDYPAVTTVAVKDLDVARKFYEGVLGCRPAEDVPDGVMYTAGDGRLFVYESGHAGTNKATYFSVQVPPDRFDAEVADLRGKVELQTFEMEGISWSDGVATLDGVYRAVWIADPDGNLIGVETATR